MTEHTDLEKKLLHNIAFLLGVINVYEMALHRIYGETRDNFNWMNKNFDEWDKNNRIGNMLEELNKEFDWNFTHKSLDEETTES